MFSLITVAPYHKLMDIGRLSLLLFAAFYYGTLWQDLIIAVKESMENIPVLSHDEVIPWYFYPQLLNQKAFVSVACTM